MQMKVAGWENGIWDNADMRVRWMKVMNEMWVRDTLDEVKCAGYQWVMSEGVCR